MHEWFNDVRKQRGQNQDEHDGGELVQHPESEGNADDDEKDLQDDMNLEGRGHREFGGPPITGIMLSANARTYSCSEGTDDPRTQAPDRHPASTDYAG